MAQSASNVELFEALDALEKEKNIPKDYMLEKIRTALLTAVKRENAVVDIDEVKKTFRMYYAMNVVEEVENPALELTLEQAKLYNKKAAVGDVVQVEVATKDFNRITAATGKQVIIQAIRESEHGTIYNELSSKAHEVLTAVVSRIDRRTGDAFLEVGGREDASEAILRADEQIKGEVLTEGERIKVYLVEVRKGLRAVQMITSRTHPGLVKSFASCWSWRSPRSTTAPSKSRTSPARPVRAPRSRSGPPTRTSIRWAPASGRRERGWRPSFPISAAKRSISSAIPKTRPNT